MRGQASGGNASTGVEGEEGRRVSSEGIGFFPVVMAAPDEGTWPVQRQEEALRARFERVEEALAQALAVAGRRREDVQIVVASKTAGVERMRVAWRAGLRVFGENRAQELRQKAVELADLPIEWHFIGHLQRNKVKDVLPHVRLVHSVDRWELAQAMERWLAAASAGMSANQRLPVLLEVNVSGEVTKSGVAPAQLPELARQVAQLPHLALEGLMTVASPNPDPDEVRQEFARLRRLSEQVAELRLPGVEMRHLSMGMSRDFPLAVLEGATLIRLGTALLGPRPLARTT